MNNTHKEQNIFSGIQPTGCIHIGNYFGAIQQWVDLQHSYQCSLFCIVDLHAMTVDYDPYLLRENTYQTIAAYLACGIDPEKSLIFIQSDIVEHLQLYWILNCITPSSWLMRMTQFKDKYKKIQALGENKIYAGLLNYPILMASDILLYNTDIVPVGEDQIQHIELTCQIARAFNAKFNKSHFKIPKPLINNSKRIMSLRDGSVKMSKSDTSEYSRINIIDDNDTISKKIAKAKTDSFENLTDNIEQRPEVRNLATLYSQLKNQSLQQTLEDINHKSHSSFKKDITDLLINCIEPIANRYKLLITDRDYLDQIVDKSLIKVRDIAKRNFEQIKNIAMG